jgi:hypothetical protein
MELNRVMDNLKNTITNFPIEKHIEEGISQRNRLLEEVMGCLFEQIKTNSAEFFLADGTVCRIKPFTPPSVDINDELRYGFDVVMDDKPVSHLEFTVKCTGWERSG